MLYDKFFVFFRADFFVEWVLKEKPHFGLIESFSKGRAISNTPARKKPLKSKIRGKNKTGSKRGEKLPVLQGASLRIAWLPSHDVVEWDSYLLQHFSLHFQDDGKNDVTTTNTANPHNNKVLGALCTEK